MSTRKEEIKISLDKIYEDYKKISNIHQHLAVNGQQSTVNLIIEGAGGLMVPLGTNFLVRDLITELACPVIVVSRNQLGTINHTLLSVFALQEAVQEQIKIVTMEPEIADSSSETNKEVLTQMIKSKIFSIPFFGQKAASREVIGKNYKKIKKTLAAILECD